MIEGRSTFFVLPLQPAKLSTQAGDPRVPPKAYWRGLVFQGQAATFWFGNKLVKGTIEVDGRDASLPGDALTSPSGSPQPEGGAAAKASVTLTVGIQDAVNAALWANHVSLLSEFTLVNAGAEALGDVAIDLETEPPAIAPKTWRLGEVGAGQARVLRDLDLSLEGSWLSSLTESVRGCVTFTVRAGDRIVAKERQDLRFLAHNEWGGNGQIPDLLAAFVQPNDPAIPRILRKASDLLRAQGKPDSLEGYQATSKTRLWEQLAAIWSAICSFDIRYVNPPPSFEQTGQRIRPPRQIMEERLATCLDLAVLFAACIEHAGIRPLTLLYGRNGKAMSIEPLFGARVGRQPVASNLIGGIVETVQRDTRRFAGPIQCGLHQLADTP